MSIRWSSEQEASLLKDFAEGASIESIGAKLGKTVGNVNYKLKMLLENLVKTNDITSVCSQMNMTVDQLKQYVNIPDIILTTVSSESSSTNSIREEIARIRESLARLEASL